MFLEHIKIQGLVFLCAWHVRCRLLFLGCVFSCIDQRDEGPDDLLVTLLCEKSVRSAIHNLQHWRKVYKFRIWVQRLHMRSIYCLPLFSHFERNTDGNVSTMRHWVWWHSKAESIGEDTGGHAYARFIELCNANSTPDSNLSQPSPSSLMQWRSMLSITSFILSIVPSVCGWYAVDMLSRTCKSSTICFHPPPINHLSRSLIIESRTPWNCVIICSNLSKNWGAIKPLSVSGARWHMLLSLSTDTVVFKTECAIVVVVTTAEFGSQDISDDSFKVFFVFNNGWSIVIVALCALVLMSSNSRARSQGISVDDLNEGRFLLFSNCGIACLLKPGKNTRSNHYDDDFRAIKNSLHNRHNKFSRWPNPYIRKTTTIISLSPTWPSLARSASVFKIK